MSLNKNKKMPSKLPQNSFLRFITLHKVNNYIFYDFDFFFDFSFSVLIINNNNNDNFF